jgi:hypothetical protein
MLGGRWQQKPPQGTPLDPAHPLAQGLVAAWAFNEGTGTPIELVGRSYPAASAGFAWSSGQYGPAGAFNGSTTNLVYAMPPTTGVISLAGSCSMANTGNAGTAVTRGINSIWAVYNAGGSGFEWRGASATVRNTIPQSSLAAGVRFSWGVADTGVGTNATNGSTMYLNGAAVPAGGSSGNAPPAPSSGAAILGSYGGGGYFGGTQEYIYIWNYALSAAQMAAVAANPWQIFAPRPFGWLAKAAAAAAAGALAFPRTYRPPNAQYWA